MTNEEIARRFERLATLMTIPGDDQFRTRSYRNAAEVIETWPTPLSRIAAEEGVKGLQTLPGVGKAISAKIVELLERGTFEAWEKLTAETPETVLDLLRVEGVGMKTAAALHQQFKISSLADLRQFVERGGADEEADEVEDAANKLRVDRDVCGEERPRDVARGEEVAELQHARLAE